MAGGGENGRIEGTRRSGAWDRRTVDFALLVSRRRARATREPSRGRKWPIPRPQRVHALQYLPIRLLPLSTNNHPRVPPSLMSLTHPAGPSSPNFQLVFNNALKAYEKQTKSDLLSHPLAAQLQACQSSDSILAILQQQVQELDQSRISDKRLTKWLEPTVNVLYAFSETIGEGVSLVRPMTRAVLTFGLLSSFGRFSRPQK